MTTADRNAVTCSWCSQYYPSRPANGHCDNCGGPLPAPSGTQRGMAPPGAPRTLPAAYRRAMMLGRNVLTILGIVFTSVGAPFLVVGGGLLGARGASAHILSLVFGLLGLVFSGVGLSLLLAGLARGRRRLAALEQGVPAEGTLASIELNGSVRINGKSPWVIEYTFNTARGAVRGSVQSFGHVDGERQVGDHVWVVYLADDPQTNALWPPVRA